MYKIETNRSDEEELRALTEVAFTTSKTSGAIRHALPGARFPSNAIVLYLDLLQAKARSRFTTGISGFDKEATYR